MGNKPVWLLSLGEILSLLHGIVNKPLLCSQGAHYIYFSRLLLYKQFWKDSPKQMQLVLIECTEMWETRGELSSKNILLRLEETDLNSSLRPFMRRFWCKDLNQTWCHLGFPPVLHWPSAPIRSIKLSKVWLTLLQNTSQAYPFLSTSAWFKIYFSSTLL